MNTIGEIADILKKLKSAVIFTHMRPDGDTIGCALALCRAFCLLHKRCEVVNEGEIPQKLRFLEGAERIRNAPSLDAQAYICVDCSDETRLGDLQKTFSKGAKKRITVNIDHHVSNAAFCRYNFVRERASNCENIAEILHAMGVAYDRQIANALFMGMVTDSGGFSHGDVNGDSFRAAAECADAGADVARVTYEAYKKQTRARAELYAETISHIRYLLDGKLAVAVVPFGTLERYGLQTDATEGIVDFALNVDTVEVSVCLLEVKKGQYKASLRSQGRANVNEVAGMFGGGGHVLASGCMFFGEIEEVEDRLAHAVSLQL